MDRKIIHEFKCQQAVSSFARTEQGQYCGECKTHVIDFSEKTNQEIIDIISMNGGKVCGSIFKGQLEENTTSPFSFRNKVAVTSLAALLGMGVETASAGNPDRTQTEIVISSELQTSFAVQVQGEHTAQPAIETPDKPEKKKKERKRKTFMRIGSVSFYTQNVFPFIGARRVIVGRMRW